VKEFMPGTHASPELIRGYAEGFTYEADGEKIEVQMNFDDIATDRGPRMESTLDMFPGQIPPYAWGPETWTRKRVEPYERKLSEVEKAALDKANEDNLVMEQQLWMQAFDPWAQSDQEEEE